MRQVNYFAPTDVGEAVKLLAEHGSKVAVLAGGTDLVPQLNYYEIKPAALLYIGGLGLDYIKQEGDVLVIGAGTTLAHLLSSEMIATKFPILAAAAHTHGSPAVRTTATIGGNLGTASPAGDLIPPLMVMDAQVILVSVRGQRSVAIQDFFTGPGETVRAADELIVEIRVPLLPGNAVFEKTGLRKAQTCSIASAAVRLATEGGACHDVRVVLGSMAPTPLRCLGAEALLRGQPVTAETVAACAAQAVAETSPISDQRATAWYRQKAAEALVRRALTAAAGL